MHVSELIQAYILIFFSQKKELTQMEECILFIIQQEQHSGRTQGIKGKAQACVCLLFSSLYNLLQSFNPFICTNVRIFLKGAKL